MNDEDLKLSAILMAGLLANTTVTVKGFLTDERLAEISQLAVRCTEALRNVATKEEGPKPAGLPPTLFESDV